MTQTRIIAMRHRIVHAYFDLDWQILWDAATDDIPKLRRQVLDIAKTEFRNPNPIENVGPGRIRTRKQRAFGFGS